MTASDTKTYSMNEIKQMVATGDYVPTRADAIEGPPLGEEFWKNARVVMPGEGPKVHISLRLDREILAWFKVKKGYQSRINAVLRAYVEAQKSPQDSQ